MTDTVQMSPDRFIGEVIGIAELKSLHINVGPNKRVLHPDQRVQVIYTAERNTKGYREDFRVEGFGRSIGMALRNAREGLRRAAGE